MEGFFMFEERRGMEALLFVALAFIVFIFTGSVFWAFLVGFEAIFVMAFISTERTKSNFLKLLLHTLVAIGAAFVAQAIANT